MRTAIFLGTLCSLTLTVIADGRLCFCPQGFEATIDSVGKAWCAGMWNKLGITCSVFEPPECVCHGADAVDGGWFHERNVRCFNTKTNKKWPCENEVEWEDYYNRRHIEITGHNWDRL